MVILTFLTKSSVAGKRLHTRFLVLILILVTLAGCASTSPELAVIYQQASGDFDRDHLIDPVAFYPQKRYQCGPAALATILIHSGIPATPDSLVHSVYIPDLKGSLQVEMLVATRQHKRLAYELDPTLESLFQEINSNVPVLVLQNLGFEFWPRWHYAVVVGYDLTKRTITLHSGTTKNYTMKLVTFERTWKRADNWAMLAVAPGVTTKSMNEDEYFISAVAFEKVNQPQVVEKVYLAGVKRWPSALLLKTAYANFLYHQNRLDESAEQYQAILNIHPDDATVHNNLAQVLMEMGQMDLAERHASIAVELGGQYADRYSQTLNEIRSLRQK